MDNKLQKFELKKDESGLHLKFKYETNDRGETCLVGFGLSDGTSMNNPTKETMEKYLLALKETTGTDNFDYSLKILLSISSGMPQEQHKDRIDHAAIMLAALKPQDATEALLYGQFISLQEAGLRCVGRASRQDMFYHEERYFLLGTKLLAQANATMQALIKYRTQGKQVVQVVHLYNEGGRAIITQNLSSAEQGEGGVNKKP